MYVWLHKGAFSCAWQLCNGEPTTAYVDYCVERLKLLLYYEVVPVLVFDGAALPMKAETHKERQEKRDEALKKAKEFMRQGNNRAAQDCFQRAVPVTVEMAREVIKQCRKMNLEYIVAPYEADAQLAWMTMNGHIDCVLTEDSDLVVYGAPKVLYKLTKDGFADLYQSKNLPSLDDPPMYNITPDMFMWMCVCAGCDFFPGVRNLGVKRAHALVKKHRTITRLVHSIRADHRYPVSKTFVSDFYRACLVFRHQTIFDITNGKAAHLSEFSPAHIANLPSGIVPKMDNGKYDVGFLGHQHTDSIMRRIAKGLIHPKTLKEYSTPLDVVERPILKQRGRDSKAVMSAAAKSSRSSGFKVFPAKQTASTLVRQGKSLAARIVGGPLSFDPRSLARHIKGTTRPETARSAVPAPSMWNKFKRPSSDSVALVSMKRSYGQSVAETRQLKKPKFESPNEGKSASRVASAPVKRSGGKSPASNSTRAHRSNQTPNNRVSPLLAKNDIRRFTNRTASPVNQRSTKTSPLSIDPEAGATIEKEEHRRDSTDVQMTQSDDDSIEIVETEGKEEDSVIRSRFFVPNKRLLLPSASLTATAHSRPLVREVARSVSKRNRALEKFRKQAQRRTVVNDDTNPESETEH